LNFDWEASADSWSEVAVWNLVLDDGTVVINNEEIWASSTGPGTNGKGTGNLDTSTYIGKSCTITFGIIASSYCANGDHGNTYLWIDNVI
jgi:hypothetical protein